MCSKLEGIFKHIGLMAWTDACVHVVRQICLKILSNLLHMELTRTQVHKYDFSNRFGYALHVDVVQI